MINKRRYQIGHKNIWYVMMKIQRRRMIIIYSNNTDESTCMIEISYKYIPQMQDTFIKHTWILSKRLFYSFFYGDYFNLSFWFRVLYAQCNIIKNLFKLHTRTLTFSETTYRYRKSEPSPSTPGTTGLCSVADPDLSTSELKTQIRVRALL